MRPHHYIKNLLVCMPLFFAGQITSIGLLSSCLLAVLSFCFGSSAIYAFNDLRDIEDDRKHPRKKTRPIASGKVSKSSAYILIVVLLFASMALMSFVSSSGFKILITYLLLNFSYCLHFKNIAILDVCIVALGFVLRVLAGGAVAEIELSVWIIVMTFLLALFLALAKRRDDMIIFKSTGQKLRKALDGYSLPFLDTAIAIMGSVVIVAYMNYVTSPEVLARLNQYALYLTALLVVIGVLRYLQNIYVRKDSGSPTKIFLKDRYIQATLIAWVATFTWAIYKT